MVVDVDEFRHLREMAERVEDDWLNRLADEAESEGSGECVSIEEMAALLGDHHG